MSPDESPEEETCRRKWRSCKGRNGSRSRQNADKATRRSRAIAKLLRDAASIDRSIGRSVGCPGPAVSSVLAQSPQQRRSQAPAPPSSPSSPAAGQVVAGSRYRNCQLPVTCDSRVPRRALAPPSPSPSATPSHLNVYRVNPSGPARVISRVSSTVSFRAAAMLRGAIAFPGMPGRSRTLASRLIRGAAALVPPEIPIGQKSSAERPLKHCIDSCSAAERIDHPLVGVRCVCACTRRILSPEEERSRPPAGVERLSLNDSDWCSTTEG